MPNQNIPGGSSGLISLENAVLVGSKYGLFFISSRIWKAVCLFASTWTAVRLMALKVMLMVATWSPPGFGWPSGEGGGGVAISGIGGPGYRPRSGLNLLMGIGSGLAAPPPAPPAARPSSASDGADNFSIQIPESLRNLIRAVSSARINSERNSVRTSVQ